MSNVWPFQLDLFFNISRTPGSVLLKDLSGQAPAPRPSWVAANCFLCRLWFLKPSANFGTVADVYSLEDGDTIVLSGKNAAGTLLFAGVDWAPVTEGEGDDSQTHYEAIVDLNTVALLALFTGSITQVVITGEIETRNAANTKRLSGQFDLQILRQVYADEGSPTPAAPPYPAPESIALVANLGTAAELNIDTDATFAANSDTRIPSQKAVKTAIAAEATARDVAIAAATDPYVIQSKQGERLIHNLALLKTPDHGTFLFSTVIGPATSITVYTSTGYARLINSDGTLGTQAGAGSSGIGITLTIPASGVHRPLGILSVALAGSVQSGNITKLTISSAGITATSDTSLLTGLNNLSFIGNQLTTPPVLTGLPLTSIDLSNNQLTTPPVFTGVTAVTFLNLAANRMSGSLVLTGLSGLTSFYAFANQLTSILPPTSWTGNGYGASLIGNNLLSGSALNAFYTALGTASGSKPFIDVGGNPGTTSDTPSIATAKGWTVAGS